MTPLIGSMKEFEKSEMQNSTSMSGFQIKMEEDQNSSELNHSKKPWPEDFHWTDKTSDVTTPKISPKIDEKTVNTTKWHNNTEYQCQICTSLFSEISGLIQHINAVHETSVEEYKLDFGELAQKPINYQCQICKQFLKCNEDILKR